MTPFALESPLKESGCGIFIWGRECMSLVKISFYTHSFLAPLPEQLIIQLGDSIKDVSTPILSWFRPGIFGEQDR
jgi:hypothetical protein